jgi:hypothetical protein
MKSDDTLQKKLGLAACALVAASGNTTAQVTESDWEVDTSYLSYAESDNRVSVSKTLANLVRQGESGSIAVNLVHDTMSGASPTGAIRSANSAVTYTSVSGGTGFSAANQGDYSKSTFEDTRIQAGLTIQRENQRGLKMTYGGVVSQESDYDSFGASIGAAKESDNKLTTYNLGLAFTSDTIYRSDTGGTPEPLADVESERPFTEGVRSTVDTLLGFTRVLNKQTLMQVNITLGQSNGYHSDPYKIISAADSEDRILANFHDSRPDSRTRAALYTKLVHKLKGSDNSIQLSYRLYQDNWGIFSHTGDFRYRFQITSKQFLEPHVRVYQQSEADFYRRKLDVDSNSSPILPENGFASADYRLDSLSSATLGLNYGIAISSGTQLRLRAEYLNQWFSSADYEQLGAVVLQASFKYRFK